MKQLALVLIPPRVSSDARRANILPQEKDVDLLLVDSGDLHDGERLVLLWCSMDHGIALLMLTQERACPTVSLLVVSTPTRCPS